MRRKIPSTAALIAFESAARHQSFTKAAQELSLTQGAVFKHFPTKDAIWLAAMQWVRERMLLKLHEAARAEATALEGLEAVFRAHVAFVIAHPGVPRVIFHELQQPTDVAVDGQGWIAVQSADGSEAYIRTASLQIDALGQLRTGNGLPVLGNGGPIAVPPEQKVEIGQDGTISIRALGEGPSVLAEVDRLKLVNPDLKQMEKGSDGLIRFKGSEPVQADERFFLIRVGLAVIDTSRHTATEQRLMTQHRWFTRSELAEWSALHEIEAG